MVKKQSSSEKQGSNPKTRTLEAKLKAMEREFLDLRDTLQRVQADFENAMKRKGKEVALREQSAKASILKAFLPVLDSVEEALKHSKEPGLKRVWEQLWQVFKGNNVSVIDVRGKFNHVTMECMMRSCDPKKENDVVLEVFQKGYLFNGLVLRPAKVMINACEEKNEKKGDGK